MAAVVVVVVVFRDVTDVFEAFHRDPRHRAKLEAFRVGTLVGYTPSKLVQDFRALKKELEDEGLFEVRDCEREGFCIAFVRMGSEVKKWRLKYQPEGVPKVVRRFCFEVPRK